LDQAVRDMKRNYLRYKVINVKLGKMPNTLSMAGLKILKQKERGLKLEIDTKMASIEEVLQSLIAENTVEDITIEDPSMEQVISYIYAGAGVSG